ncbi:hypothetical protein Egran_03727 [Elaphomyces granulatus]|uniref:Uncharacterized protein n=1 Tax=Elaphomyces granulatus TaxID=519963 RepID=A0A232LWV6_9EURO|nr:hypothetical protein Egran_03727 [Elaphomyces granulatus]
MSSGIRKQVSTNRTPGIPKERTVDRKHVEFSPGNGQRWAIQKICMIRTAVHRGRFSLALPVGISNFGFGRECKYISISLIFMYDSYIIYVCNKLISLREATPN